MASQLLSAPAMESNSPLAESPAIVSYTGKSGDRIDADKLRIGLEIIADDIDMAELCARVEGDIELAEALNAIFHDVDGLVPDMRNQEGGRHE